MEWDRRIGGIGDDYAAQVIEMVDESYVVAGSTESYGDPYIRRTLDNSRHNILFVRNSAPIHNRDYAVQVLEKAARDLSSLSEKTR